MSRTTAIAFGFLAACTIGYAAWRGMAANDVRMQARAAVRSARRTARAATEQFGHAVHKP